MFRPYFIATLVAAAIVAGAGCASEQDVKQLNDNQFVLRGMIASDRQQLDAVQQQVRELRDQVSEIQHSTAATGGGANAGQLADLSDRLGKVESEVNAIQVAMANSPAAAAGATGSPAGGPPPMVAEHTGCPPPPAPTWPQDLDAEIAAAESSGDPGVRQYRALLQDMKDGKYPLVLVQFNKLQRSNPKSPLIEPAEYFAANALFEMKDFGRAILQFNDLVLRYPKGKYASQSLLRQAQAFLNNGNDQLDAKLTLDTLVNKHADAPEVPAAKAMLNCIAS